MGIRPEHINTARPANATLSGTIKLAEHLGSETMFYVELADGSEVAVKADGLAMGKSGEPYTLNIPAAACHLFDAGGKAIINGDLTR